MTVRSVPEVSPNDTSPVPVSALARLTGTMYLAYPLAMHRTARAVRAVRRARAIFSAADVLIGCDCYHSNADWLARWPALLPTLAALCVAADGNGWIGYGTWIEAQDALARPIPVYLLSDTAVWPWATVAVTDRRPDNWRRYARLTPPGVEGMTHG